MAAILTRRATLAAPLALGLAPQAWAAQSIGRVEGVAGGVSRTGESSTPRLTRGAALYRGDALTTDEGAHADLRFDDGSSFSIGSGAQITLDDFVFDPDNGKGALATTVKLGAFRYISGQIAKVAPSRIAFNTPVATIGVRGTAFVAIVEPNLAGCIVLLPSPGRPSAIVVRTAAGERVVDTPFEGVEVKAAGMAPTEPAPWPKDRLNQMLGLIGE